MTYVDNITQLVWLLCSPPRSKNPTFLAVWKGHPLLSLEVSIRFDGLTTDVNDCTGGSLVWASTCELMQKSYSRETPVTRVPFAKFAQFALGQVPLLHEENASCFWWLRGHAFWTIRKWLQLHAVFQFLDP